MSSPNKAGFNLKMYIYEKCGPLHHLSYSQVSHWGSRQDKQCETHTEYDRNCHTDTMMPQSINIPKVVFAIAFF